MQINTVQSCSLITKDNSKYIEVFLKPEFIPSIEHNGNIQKFNPILLKEPSFQDFQDICKLSMMLTRIFMFADNEQHKLLMNISSAELLEEFTEKARAKIEAEKLDIKDENVKKEAREEVIRSTLQNMIYFGFGYDNKEINENYYTVIQAFSEFFTKNQKVGHYNEGFFSPCNWLSFSEDNKAFPELQSLDFMVLVKELLFVYISFFLKSFPSEILYKTATSQL
jgi:hypothetical protein